MKSPSKTGIIIIILASFATGFLMSEYKVPRKAIQLFKKKETSKFQVSGSNPSAYIHIHTPEDIVARRDSLIKYLWKNHGFPNDKLPAKVEQNISDTHFNGIENLKQIDKLTIIMEHNVQSIIYLFRTGKPDGKLMIYHHGHVTGFDRGEDVIRFFLKNGFSVLACSMPLCGMNNKPVVSTDFGSIQLLKHPDFQFLDSKDFSSVHYFAEPVAIALNYLDKNFKFQSYSMIGISGGGWTTVFYSALDDRIKNSYSAAGSAPIFLRSGDRGDYEQLLPELYRIADYLDLYILDAYGTGRKFVQVFNKYDPCCFSGDKYKVYEKNIQKSMKDLGKGSFEMWFDETQDKHAISETILKRVLDDINNR
jgi:hypothetical protein